ncbi:MAG: hypothetical protein ACRD1K_07650 [Acidimicrobiales bacterium]
MTSASWRLTPRPVADSLEELLEEAGARTRFDTAETRSGARFERVQISGETFAVRRSGTQLCRPLVEELRHDVDPLSSALASTPSCLLHGDWKVSNLGTAADGRTVLID